MKKDELIKTKTNLNKRKADFGRKGPPAGGWIEPLKEWILSAHHAEKLASSNEFDEVKSFVAKNGTNRCLADRKVAWLWNNPFPILAEKSESSTLSG